ncbi:hypothetical protein QDR37_06310 [Amnibacterium sp. CER49]|uniref:DUF6630 family protein n=1 Tax=Amnibacterium sp. CER49 TaxID=3039161 RepID=UPI00244BAB18|nr:hypothetical protein [Amnibacterium sp. CER49]MDH2443553.1 hypothetical protein [Amnibacterium sp. CER49]
MGTTDDWRRLCALLDDDELLPPAVEAALGEPDGDAWETLLDGLDDAGALAYLDAEDTGMELSDALVQLPRVFRLQPDLDEVTDTDDLAEAIAAADRVLAEHGHRLLRLEEPGTDAHALVVVPSDAVPEVLVLARSLEVPVTTAL